MEIKKGASLDMLLRIFVLFCVGILTAPGIVRGAPQDSDADRIDFVTDIKPIFENHCLRCHGPEEEEAFRIDDRDATMDYIEPGDPDESDLMYHLTTDDEEDMMPPPDEGGPLDDADIQLIRTWIEQGAEWPDGVTFQEPSEQADPNENVGEVSDSNDGDAENATGGETNKSTPVRKKRDEFEPSWTRAIGSLHPAILHIPMGLLLGAGFFALLSLRGNFVMADCAYYCLWLGALGAILACISGWYFGPMENYKPVETWDDLLDTSSKLFWHRTSAIVVTVLAVLVALYAAAARNRNPDDGLLWKLGVILLAGGVGFVGHEGGELTWNRDGKHYRDLETLMQRYVPVLAPQANEKEKDRGDRPADVNESDDDVSERDAGNDDATGVSLEFLPNADSDNEAENDADGADGDGADGDGASRGESDRENSAATRVD